MSFEGASFSDPKVTQTGENKFFVQHGTDKNLIVEFYTDAEYLEFESSRLGRATYRDVEMIRIRTPGLHGNTVERKVKTVSDGSAPSDLERFPGQWQRFKAQQAQVPDGFPVEQWPALKKSQVMSLKAQGIHVVEQIAALPDSSLDVLGMEGRRLREQAKGYLNKDLVQAQLSSLTVERDQFKADLEAIKATISELQGGDAAATLAALAEARKEIDALKAAATSTPEPKKRGRPSTKNKETA